MRSSKKSLSPSEFVSIFRKSPGLAFAVTLSTGFGSGLSPVAPGTAGTVVAVPMIIALHSLEMTSWSSALIFWIAMTVLGAWAAAKIRPELPSGDHPSIVFDEVIGFGISCLGLSQLNLPLLVAAFILFRFFDIAKLPPVSWIDRRSKTLTGFWGGLGVMADDILAGIQTWLVLQLMIAGNFLPLS